MKHFLAIAALILSTSANGNAGVVTFDDLIGTNLLADGYGGINWGGNWSSLDSYQPPFHPHSPSQRVYTETDMPGEVQFTFAAPNRSFQGAYFAGVAGTSVHFNLYDDGNLVWSSSQLNVSDIPAFLASGYSGNVDTVGVYSLSNRFYVMDDVTYDASAVPEPGTFGLLAAAATAAIGYRRMKARA